MSNITQVMVERVAESCNHLTLEDGVQVIEKLTGVSAVFTGEVYNIEDEEFSIACFAIDENSNQFYWES